MSAMPKAAKRPPSQARLSGEQYVNWSRPPRARGEDLTGPDGLLKMITATVLQAALDEEMTEHLGHAKHQPTVDPGGNVRNGTRPKTVPTDAAGEVSIEVPRDRA